MLHKISKVILLTI